MTARNGGLEQSVRRGLGVLPCAAQSYRESPYFDMSLYSYDEKCISHTDRLKNGSEFPAKVEVAPTCPDAHTPRSLHYPLLICAPAYLFHTRGVGWVTAYRSFTPVNTVACRFVSKRGLKGLSVSFCALWRVSFGVSCDVYFTTVAAGTICIS